MKVFRHSKTVLVLVLSAVFIYVGLLNLLDRMDWQKPADGINWKQGQQGVEVGSLRTPKPVGGAGGLEAGDRLTEINGIPIRNIDEYTEVVELLAETLPPGTQATYLVQKAGSESSSSYPVPIQLESTTGAIDFLLAFVAVAHLAIGLFIFLRHWKAQGAFHFYLICAIAFVLYLYRYSGRADRFDLVVYWTAATALLLLPPLFLHFCRKFPQPLSWPQAPSRLQSLLYLPFALLLGLHVLWFSGSLQPLGLPRTEVLANLFDRIHLTFFSAFFVLGILALVRSHRLAPSAVQRLQIKWISRGAAVGILPFLCFYVTPYLVGIETTAYMESSVLALVLIPLTFGYAVTKRRLPDVELLFKQGATHVVASSALLGLYVGIVLLIGRAIQGFSPESGFILFALSALLVAYLFSPLRNRIQSQIDRYFYREAYDLRRSFADFGRTLGSEIQLDALTEKVSDRLSITLNVAPIAIFLRDEAKADTYRLAHWRDPSSEGGAIAEVIVPNSFFSDFDRELRPLFPVPQNQAEEHVRDELARHDLYYSHPLLVRGGVVGFLALGRRPGGELLSSEDLDLVSTLAGYAAIAIDNALLYRSLETKASQLAQLKAYSENVVESITVGVVVITPEGDITVWNDSMQSLCDLQVNETLGRNIGTVFSEDFLHALQRIVDGPPWLVEEPSRLYKTRLQSNNGRDRLVNVTVSPFILQGDIVTGTLLVFDDITEKVRLETQLWQAEKLSSIGLLSAGIAHEVNTPLTAISSYTQRLLKDLPRSDPRYEVLKKIESQGFRASNIVNNLLNFARVRDSDSQEVNVNSLMLETLSLLDHQFRSASLEVKLDLQPGIPPTLANGGKLQQVFMNLFLNARDAMPEGGRINVKTYKKDSVLIVEIRDSGVGITKQDIKKIYDPFFTTKEVGKGTGLGLSVSYGIIQELAGRINVASEPGRGTTFQLYLPIKRVH